MRHEGLSETRKKRREQVHEGDWIANKLLAQSFASAAIHIVREPRGRTRAALRVACLLGGPIL